MFFNLDPNNKMLKHLLVMEYADGGSLRNYLKKNFKELTWENKYKLAFQLADNAINILKNNTFI